MRKSFLLLIVAAFLSGWSGLCVANDSTARPYYPNAVYQIVIKKEKEPGYAALAKGIGFDTRTRYTYTEYADIKRKNNVGIAGAYDFLLLSTGGTAGENDDLQRFNQQSCGWETTYYSNHSLTVIHEVCSDQARTHAWVRILKVAKGRRPNLHKE
ncbi:MAG: hypothetical protein AB1413_12570 [Thermodesulfobacteriota bacterium]